MKEVLFVLLDQYADWEAALVSSALNDEEQEEKKYTVKTVSDRNPVRSIGGFNVVPDYAFESAPEDFAGLILIGGYSWRKEEAKAVIPLVRKALDKKVPLGAICGATVFLGMNGFLNEVRHTSNTLDSLKNAAKENYTGEKNYIRQQAVSDGGIITANGWGYIEFAKEVLIALDAMPEKDIDEWYDFYKLGFYEALKKRGTR